MDSPSTHLAEPAPYHPMAEDYAHVPIGALETGMPRIVVVAAPGLMVARPSRSIGQLKLKAAAIGARFAEPV